MRRLAFVLLWLLVMWIPIENSIVIPGFGTVTRLIGVAAVLTTLLAVIVGRTLRRPQWVHLFMLAFVVEASASFLWSVSPDLSLERILTYVQLFLLAWVIWELAREYPQQKALLLAYCIGAAASASTTVYSYLTNHTIQGSYDARYAAWNFDPNDLGLMLAIAIPIAFYLADAARSLIQAWAFRLTVVLLATAIVLTSSRGSAIAAVAALAYIPWTFRSLSVRSKVSVIVVGVVVIYFGLPYVPQTSLERLSTIRQELTQGQLNQRTAIWKEALTEFAKRPMGGVGAGAFRAFGDPLLVAHNAFVSVLAEQGLPGFLIFLGIITLLVASIPKIPARERALWGFLLMTWAIGVFALSWEYRKPTWFLFALMACQAHSSRKAGLIASTDANLPCSNLAEGDRS